MVKNIEWAKFILYLDHEKKKLNHASKRIVHVKLEYMANISTLKQICMLIDKGNSNYWKKLYYKEYIIFFFGPM